MAANDMNDLMDFIKKSEFGAYPESGTSDRTRARRDVIATAPADIQSLRGSYPEYFVERLARLAEDNG